MKHRGAEKRHGGHINRRRGASPRAAISRLNCPAMSCAFRSSSPPGGPRVRREAPTTSTYAIRVLARPSRSSHRALIRPARGAPRREACGSRAAVTAAACSAISRRCTAWPGCPRAVEVPIIEIRAVTRLAADRLDRAARGPLGAEDIRALPPSARRRSAARSDALISTIDAASRLMTRRSYLRRLRLRGAGRLGRGAAAHLQHVLEGLLHRVDQVPMSGIISRQASSPKSTLPL